MLNLIANNASNIDVCVRFTAGRTILAETGLVCYEMDQFLSKYQFVSIILVDRSRTSIYMLNSIANNTSNIDVYIRFTANGSAVKRT